MRNWNSGKFLGKSFLLFFCHGTEAKERRLQSKLSTKFVSFPSSLKTDLIKNFIEKKNEAKLVSYRKPGKWFIKRNFKFLREKSHLRPLLTEAVLTSRCASLSQNTQLDLFELPVPCNPRLITELLQASIHSPLVRTWLNLNLQWTLQSRVLVYPFPRSHYINPESWQGRKKNRKMQNLQCCKSCG